MKHIALRNDGTVWEWGGSRMGHLGDDRARYRHIPRQVQDLADIVSISAGGSPIASHAMALRSDGTIWAWGANSIMAMVYEGNGNFSIADSRGGQLGDGTTKDRRIPVQGQTINNVMLL